MYSKASQQRDAPDGPVHLEQVAVKPAPEAETGEAFLNKTFLSGDATLIKT